MLTSDTDQWEFVTQLHSGHRIFRDRGVVKGLAIVDNSGDKPEDGEDGILWLEPLSFAVIACTGSLPWVELKVNTIYRVCVHLEDIPKLTELGFVPMLHATAQGLAHTWRRVFEAIDSVKVPN